LDCCVDRFVGSVRTSGAKVRAMGVIDPIYFLLISESNNETYLPTFRRSPQAHSWLPSTHGNPRWPRCAERTSRQRP